MRLACCALVVAVHLLASTQPTGDLFDFFQPGVDITSRERARLNAGAPVVFVLDAKHRDIAVFSAIELSTTVTPERFVAWLQIFATHYLDACLGVTALVRDPETARSYLVYVNRSDVDLLAGFWGGLARHMIEERIAADGPGLLRDVARKLSNGDPPQPGFGPGQRQDESRRVP